MSGDGSSSSDQSKQPSSDQSKQPEDEPRKIFRHISVLLDWLERQSDNRLEAQFEETRSKLSAPPGQIAVPPCKRYATFLMRLSQIESSLREGTPPSGSQVQANQDDPALDDISFLRWSRDFLAAIAAPVTVESIEITRQFMELRAGSALSWFFQRWFDLFRKKGQQSPRMTAALFHAGKLNNEFTDSARWLANTVRSFEAALFVSAVIAVLLSAFATVGQSITSNEQKALQQLRAANENIERDIVPILLSARMVNLPSDTELVCLPSANYKRLASLSNQAIDGGVSANSQTQARGDTPGVNAKSIDELMVRLSSDCRSWRWALIEIVAEKIRLKSWIAPFTSDRIAPLIRFNPLKYLVGWNSNDVSEFASTADDQFCKMVEAAYRQKEPESNSVGCPHLIRLMVEERNGIASSIQWFITESVLPCFYGFIGAVLATLFMLGQKIDSSLLSYTDRGRVRFNGIMGFVFGAIIGLFAGWLAKDTETSGLGLSAFALLAGINAPGFFSFLTELSNRVFGAATAPAKPA
jgi:hypothetical protein